MVIFRRSNIPGGIYFLTATLLDRRSKLLTENMPLLRNAIKEVKLKHPFTIQALVVLPDHFHALLKMPDDDSNYSMRLRFIKTLFTKSIIRKNPEFIKNKRGEYNIWQRRFWEHTIQTEEDFENHFNYIHYNPVKHGLVRNVSDWEYSTFHHYVRKRILPGDWGGDVRECNGKFGE